MAMDEPPNEEQLSQEMLDDMRVRYLKRVRTIILVGITTIVLLAIVLKP